MHSEPHIGDGGDAWLQDMWQRKGSYPINHDSFDEDSHPLTSRIPSALSQLNRPRGRARAGTLPSRLGVGMPHAPVRSPMSLADSFESSLFAAVDEAANAPAPIGHGGSISTDMTSSTNTIGAARESDPFFSHGTESIDYLGVPDTTRVRERSVTDAPLPKFLPVGAAPGARAVRTRAPPHARPPESLLARPRAIPLAP